MSNLGLMKWYSTSMMRVLILANGAPPGRETAQLLASRHDLIIAVDGAIYAAAKIGLTPDILTGDFDSVRLEAVCADYPKLRVIRTPDQDKSDLEKAVDTACDLGATDITVTGTHLAGGWTTRWETPPSLLTACAPICLADDFGTVRAARNNGIAETILALQTSAGDTVSLITFDPDTSVSIAGVHWPLSGPIAASRHTRS